MLLPFVSFFYIYRHKHNLNDPTFNRKYQSLYENVDITKKTALAYNSINMLRKLLLAVMYVFLSEVITVQLLIGILSTLSMIIYLIQIEPFKDKRENWIQVFNEICIMSVLYVMYCFSELNLHPSTFFNLGWMPIFIILLNYSVNTYFILKDSIIKMKARICRKKPETV